jgi:hypothetical protein
MSHTITRDPVERNARTPQSTALSLLVRKAEECDP